MRYRLISYISEGYNFNNPKLQLGGNYEVTYMNKDGQIKKVGGTAVKFMSSLSEVDNLRTVGYTDDYLIIEQSGTFDEIKINVDLICKVEPVVQG